MNKTSRNKTFLKPKSKIGLRLGLNDLAIEELQIILEHLKLGMPHLKKQLTPKQFNELEVFGAIEDADSVKFKSNKIEKFCHLAMVLNSIISGIFGVWMGFVASLDLDIASNLIPVTGFALLCGGIMGIATIIANIKKSKNAVSQIRLQNFESQVFEEIHQKQQRLLSEITEKLKKRYVLIAGALPEKEPKNFEKKEDFCSWFYLFHQAIHQKLNKFPKEDIFQHYRNEALRILRQTEETYIKAAELIGNFAASLRKNVTTFQFKEIPVLNLLMDPSLSKPKEEIEKDGWGKKNIFNMALTLIPAILGSLGSILMWCNSITIFRSFFLYIEGNGLSLPSQCTPCTKMVISIIFTSNFAFFYFYSQKKTLMRKSKINEKRKSLLNQEAMTVQMSQRLNLMLSLDARIEEIMKFLEYSNIFHYISNTEGMVEVPIQKLTPITARALIPD